MDDRAREAVKKIQAHVAAKFGGDYHAAFRFYDKRSDGKLVAEEIIQLLEDCDVGNWWTRGVWANGIITALDTDRDLAVSFAELEAALKADVR